MITVVRMRSAALGVLVLLGVASALGEMAWLASRTRTRSPAGPGSSVERVIARAEQLLKAGRPREALRAISGVEGAGPQAAELLLVEGLAWAALGESEPSREALLRSIAIRPNQPMAVKVLAAIAFSRGEEQRGLDYLARAAALDPGDFRPLYAVGDAHLRMGRMEAAIGAFTAALRRKPDHGESRIGLAAASLVVRPAEQSSDMIRGLLRDFPGNPKVALLAARHARALGDAESALRYAERALALDPELVDAMVIRAQLLFATGRRESALAEATRAAEREPRNPQALAILAQLQAALGQAGRARETQARRREVVAQSERIHELTDEIARQPEDPAPRWQLGQLAAATGERGLAIESYRAALALDRQCQPALAGLRSLQETSTTAAPPAARSSSSPGPRTAGR